MSVYGDVLNFCVPRNDAHAQVNRYPGCLYAKYGTLVEARVAWHTGPWSAPQKVVNLSKTRSAVLLPNLAAAGDDSAVCPFFADDIDAKISKPNYVS